MDSTVNLYISKLVLQSKSNKSLKLLLSDIKLRLEMVRITQNK